MIRLSCRPAIVDGHGSRLIRSPGQLVVLNMDMGLTDALAVGHNPDMNMKINTESPRLAVTPGEWNASHRLVRFRLYSVVFSLQGIDDLDISRESLIPQKLHLGTTDRRITPEICSPKRPTRVEIYFLLLRDIVLLLCSFCRAFTTGAMVSDRSPDMDRVGPSYAPSVPLPGRFFGPSLDISSDLAPDIPGVMGLRALMPSAAVVKVMSVPDSRCIRVVTPDDHVNIGFHDILLHDMGEEELPFVATSELDYLRRIWPRMRKE